MCNQCNKKPVYQSKVNKINYCRSCFSKYFERKVRKCIRVNKLINKKDKLIIAIKGTSSLVALHLIKNILKNRKVKTIRTKNYKIKTITGFNLDNEVENIVTNAFNKKKPKLGPKLNKEIRPLYLVTEEEVKIFAKLNKIKLTKQKQSKITKLINNLEQKYPGTKYAIVKSALKLKEIS